MLLTGHLGSSPSKSALRRDHGLSRNFVMLTGWGGPGLANDIQSMHCLQCDSDFDFQFQATIPWTSIAVEFSQYPDDLHVLIGSRDCKNTLAQLFYYSLVLNFVPY